MCCVCVFYLHSNLLERKTRVLFLVRVLIYSSPRRHPRVLVFGFVRLPYFLYFKKQKCLVMRDLRRR